MVSSSSSDLTSWWWILDFVLHQPSVPDSVAKCPPSHHPPPRLLRPPPPRIQRHLLLRRLSSTLPLSFTTLRSLDLLHSLVPSLSLAVAYTAVAVDLAAADFAAPSPTSLAPASPPSSAAPPPRGSSPTASGLRGRRWPRPSRIPSSVRGSWIGGTRSAARRWSLGGDEGFGCKVAGGDGPPFLEVAAQVVMGENRALMRERSPLRNGIANESREIKFDSTLTPEVDNVTNALKSSCADLQKVVEDPLPDAVVAADEWNDSIDSLSEKSLSPSNKPYLPTPKSRMVSPLKLVESKKVSKRRKFKRWSLLEEETLRKAVQEHGKGSWKAILNSYADIFEERTEVDLKDKWRNMTRH
uniref:Uncharacterized protein n=1 Tax=Ananas comosus var. bracteatus TaxID=296719 RepID=A0A6V7NPP8_ANACO|nr:unnamed protein product [Ananas comosus var. bracteatus]